MRPGIGSTRKAGIAFVVVLCLTAVGLGVYALAAQALPAPTISAAPSNPTAQTSASFIYTDSKPITRFECRLDSAAFATCGTTRPSTKSYPGPLAPGPHTFQVRAVSGSQTSATTSYTWAIDVSSPYVVSINRVGANPTNASSVSWQVTFSEAVTGVGADDFTLVSSGLLLPLITSVSGSGAVYTVKASTGLGASGTLGLNLVDNDSIRDLAGNRLGGTGAGNGNFSGQVYTIDKIRPPEPHFTQTPPNPSSTSVSTFAWTDAEAGVAFQCKIENGSWHACTSPYTFTVATTNNGEHQFAVRAVDAAGNISDDEDYKWKVVAGATFTISGSVSGLYPGVWRPIAITFTNPNNHTIYVTSLTVTVSSSPASCAASTNVEIQQAPLTTSHTATVPANGSAPLAAADRPMIRLKDLPTTNQDACKGATFSLSYSGTATK
jgi:hypothetical protein